MIYQNFKNSNPIIAILFGIVIFLFFLFWDYFILNWGLTSLEFMQLSWWQHIQLMLNYLIIFIISWFFNSYLIQHKLQEVSNYYPFLLMLFIGILFPLKAANFNSIIALVFTLLFTLKAIDFQNIKQQFVKVFGMGLLVGLALVFNFSFLPFLVFSILVIAWIKITSVRDYLALILGAIYPFFLMLCFQYYQDNHLEWLVKKSGEISLDSQFLKEFKISYAIVVFYLITTLVLGLNLIAVLDKKIIKHRLQIKTIFLFFVTGIFTLLLDDGWYFFEELNLIIAMPMAFFVNNYFSNFKKKLIPEILSLVFILFLFLTRLS